VFFFLLNFKGIDFLWKLTQGMMESSWLGLIPHLVLELTVVTMYAKDAK
jgi:hypothetical protein